MSNDVYKIGYKKPPLQTRFKSGTSGNPLGRPKKSESFAALLHCELDKLLPITVNGRKKSVPTKQVMVKSLINLAIKGHFRAYDIILQFMRENPETPKFELKPYDIQIVNDIAKSFLNEIQKGPSEEYGDEPSS